jgi:hypothetical protein
MAEKLMSHHSGGYDWRTLVGALTVATSSISGWLAD